MRHIYLAGMLSAIVCIPSPLTQGGPILPSVVIHYLGYTEAYYVHELSASGTDCGSASAATAHSWATLRPLRPDHLYLESRAWGHGTDDGWSTSKAEFDGTLTIRAGNGFVPGMLVEYPISAVVHDYSGHGGAISWANWGFELWRYDSADPLASTGPAATSATFTAVVGETLNFHTFVAGAAWLGGSPHEWYDQGVTFQLAEPSSSFLLIAGAACLAFSRHLSRQVDATVHTNRGLWFSRSASMR